MPAWEQLFAILFSNIEVMLVDIKWNKTEFIYGYLKFRRTVKVVQSWVKLVLLKLIQSNNYFIEVKHVTPRQTQVLIVSSPAFYYLAIPGPHWNNYF